MNSDLWQQETIKQLKAHLSQDRDVRGLVLIGSLARSEISPDLWSDVDLAVIVRDEALEHFWPTTDWLPACGEVFCTSQSSTDDWHVNRIWFSDGRRVDIVIITEGSLARIEEWGKNPLSYINICLFSCSDILDRALKLEFPTPAFRLASDEDFERMANDFWFKGMLAVSKAGREELLVALHLALDMVRDCLVLAMMIRDRDTGTDHHRDGSRGNQFVPALDNTRQPYTAKGILDSIEQSAIAFDRLAAQWDKSYKEHRHALLNWIARAREYLNE